MYAHTHTRMYNYAAKYSVQSEVLMIPIDFLPVTSYLTDNSFCVWHLTAVLHSGYPGSSNHSVDLRLNLPIEITIQQ
jgi:hypothetical protein